MLKTLRGKFTVLFMSLVFLIGLVGITGFFNLYMMEKSVDGLMTNNYKSISTVAKMMEAIERQDSAISMYISIDSKKGLEMFNDKYAQFIRWNQVEVNNVTEKGEETLVGELNRQYEKYVKLFTQLQEIYGSGNEKQAVSYYENSILPLFYDIKSTLNDLSRLNEKAMFNSREDAIIKAKKSMYMLMALSMLAVIGGYILAAYFMNRFLGPLHKLTEGISRVKAGELDQQLEIGSNDETGKLAIEFNEMTSRLRNYEKSTLGSLMAEKNKSIAIVKSISDPLFVLDVNYRIVLVNDAAEDFFEIEENKAIGRHFLEMVRDGNIFDHISNSIETGEEHCEKILQLSNVSDFYFNVVVTLVKDTDRRNTGLIVAFQDVTELKELEKVKTDFIATISHEFKTPLTSIMMAASILSEKGMGELNSEQKETVGTIMEDGERLSNLVNELLELSRIESGRAVYNFEVCSLNVIVESSISGFVETADRRKVMLINKMEENLPMVTADSGKVCWVVNNLLSNALKYTDAGDSITISSEVGNGFVDISVHDDGKGIPEEYLDRIFDRFVQVKNHEIEVRGTGLGLSVAREIITAHGGSIHVESEVDIGSTFTFSLPIAS